jgi:putrescine transport system permease protein
MSEHARPWPLRRLLVAAVLLFIAAASWLISNRASEEPAPLLRLLAVSCAVAGTYIAVLTVIVRRFQVRTSTFNISALLFGFAFLYVPILVMIVFSFNSSRLVTSWGGFSLRWYRRLFENEQILSTAGLSLQIAAINATGAVILGTLAGLALARFGRFKGRTLFMTMTTAPLVMPEVITGLSLLLLFIAMEQLFGWPSGRGVTTVTIAHMTLTMAYVTVIVRSRLASLDESLEEAAMDLGARPARIFFVITLPIIAPALVSGWLLAFTISLDDVVLASFVSGPGSGTLPLLIFSKMRLGITPDINALAAILVLLVTVGVVIAAILSARAERRRVAEMQLVAAENK